MPKLAAAPSQAVLKLSEMGLPEIHLEVDERDIGMVKPGHRALVTADAYPDREVETQVERIGSRAETARGIIDVVLRPAEHPLWLRSGMTVDASIILGGKRKLLVIPTTSLIRIGEKAYVMAVDAGVVRQLEIRLGMSSREGAVVLSGLTAESAVIAEPLRVEPGQPVQAVERPAQEARR